VIVEVVAVGTELLLGQLVNTNAAWLGERLASLGLDCYFQTTVGDNQARIVSAIEHALKRSDAVITCGGLGPTQDDITREAVAEVMGVPLIRDSQLLEAVRAAFVYRGRRMTSNNERQADVPEGATPIPQKRGTAPGLICPVRRDGYSRGNGEQVIYVLPGPPSEMKEMFDRAVVPDLLRRAGKRHVIASRTLRTWGIAESTLADKVSSVFDELEEEGAPITLAFQASGIEGIKIRLTAKATDLDDAKALLDAKEAELREILGDLVFGVDDETMEVAVARLLEQANLSIALAESLTGGLVAARIVSVAGASRFFKGSIVCYDTEVKRKLLSVTAPSVVSEKAARQMADSVRTVLNADVGLALTGVAGPTPQDGQPPGTVFIGLALPNTSSHVVQLLLPGDRQQVREFASISALDALRKRLLNG